MKGRAVNVYQANNYLFHPNDISDACFCCARKESFLIVVRHQASNKLVHLCSECMTAKSDEYLLDNTKPWTGSKS
ncbi:MAG: hypothetical protein APR62_13275 [Smithella sp. SDB]|nr:MAG: hypothetical protein APR62_13275 [Smithella sp. SDB]